MIIVRWPKASLTTKWNGILSTTTGFPQYIRPFFNGWQDLRETNSDIYVSLKNVGEHAHALFSGHKMMLSI